VTSGNPQNATELAELIRQGDVFAGVTVLDGTEGIDQMAAVLRARAHPDFVTLMVSESAGEQEFRGVEGFKEALSDWISPYEAFRLEVEDVLSNDDNLVFLARQVATTKHDAVEVATESASVWRIRDDLISEVHFYLDRQMALKAAGIDPDRPSGD
jgi:ketosteroid isomerase-like protein